VTLHHPSPPLHPLLCVRVCIYLSLSVSASLHHAFTLPAYTATPRLRHLCLCASACDQVLFEAFLPLDAKPAEYRQGDRRRGDPSTVDCFGCIEMLRSNAVCAQYMAPALMGLYGDVERTGFYEKPTHRCGLFAVLSVSPPLLCLHRCLFSPPFLAPSPCLLPFFPHPCLLQFFADPLPSLSCFLLSSSPPAPLLVGGVRDAGTASRRRWCSCGSSRSISRPSAG
jgi:hypothetical protein